MSADDPMASEGEGVAGDFRSEQPEARRPMTWSLPLITLAGVPVRLHATFLLLAAVELLRSALPGLPRTLGLPPTAMLLGCMLAVAVLHEWVRAFAHRRIGGELAEWLLWPLGGLCNASWGGTGRQRVVASVMPWLAQMGLAVIAGGLLRWRTGLWLDGGLPMPWSLDGFRSIAMSDNGGPLWEAIWLLQWWNVVSMLLQLLPALPLTGGRVLVALLEPRLGWSQAVHAAARSGIACAAASLVAGLASGSWTLTVLAMVLWIAGRVTLDRVQATDGMLETPWEAAHEPPRQETDQAEVDRILDKIRSHGIGSLGWRERRLLKAATRRRRGADPGSR